MKAGLSSAKTAVTNLFEGGAKATVKRVWEFTKERLNPFNYERDGANINFAKKGENVLEAGAKNRIKGAIIMNPIIQTGS